MAEKCQVKRSWHGRRKQISLITTVGLAVLLLALTQTNFTPTVFKPGDLATPHAQILAGTLDSQRCASCHPQAATSPATWFDARQSGHTEIRQSDRCLDCHHGTIQRSTANLAHNLPSAALSEIRFAMLPTSTQSWRDFLPGPAFDEDDVQCSSCHREHQGSVGSLLDVSDAQCQTCHADRFGSFATSHPNWTRWPYGRGGEIAFNHATHANKHFPATIEGGTAALFQCADCHALTDNHELTRSTSYDRACKSCHDDSLRLQTADGLELLALPSLPPESAQKVTPWPESATGFLDGTLSPLAELLMRGDPEITAAIRQLPDRDLSRISPESANAIEAVELIAEGHRRLLDDISRQGQNVILERASRMGISPSTLNAFLRSLSPQIISDANRRWFDEVESASRTTRETPQGLLPNAGLLGDASNDLLVDDLEAEGDLLADDLLADDPLVDDPLLLDPLDADSETLPKTPDRFDAESMMPAGGWYRDDLSLAIRYRGAGHFDPVLKSTVDMISQLPLGDPVRESLLRTNAIAACVNCHPGAAHTSGHWHSTPLIGRKSQFTKFSHASHLNVAQLANCQHCHQIDSHSTSGSVGLSGPEMESSRELESASTIGIASIDDFSPLAPEACAGCHTPHAAGDACIKCHRYHIDLR